MYNVTSFIAIVQQTRKKPLVTELLPRSSYTWGWRCKANYDQLLSFGQVIRKWFHRRYDSGDWRWFQKKPILNHNSIVQIAVECCLAYGNDRFLFVVLARLINGYSRTFLSVITNKESPVLVVPGFRHILNLTAYFTELQALIPPSV